MSRKSAVGFTRSRNTVLSARDLALRELLAADEVDPSVADEHVARACLAIQAGWTEGQRVRAAGVFVADPVEIVQIGKLLFRNTIGD